MENPVRRLLVIFLLLLLPLHSFAVQGTWLAPGKALNVAHEIEHHQGTSHHHFDDGSAHYDDSSESTQHALEYSSPHQGVSLPSGAMPPLTLAALSVAPVEFARYIPDPVPERPIRPPLRLL
jgi:hypothetical protein